MIYAHRNGCCSGIMNPLCLNGYEMYRCIHWLSGPPPDQAALEFRCMATLNLACMHSLNDQSSFR